jgi:hypothetical protein
LTLLDRIGSVGVESRVPGAVLETTLVGVVAPTAARGQVASHLTSLVQMVAKVVALRTLLRAGTLLLLIVARGVFGARTLPVGALRSLLALPFALVGLAECAVRGSFIGNYVDTIIPSVLGQKFAGASGERALAVALLCDVLLVDWTESCGMGGISEVRNPRISREIPVHFPLSLTHNAVVRHLRLAVDNLPAPEIHQEVAEVFRLRRQASLRTLPILLLLLGRHLPVVVLEVPAGDLFGRRRRRSSSNLLIGVSVSREQL